MRLLGSCAALAVVGCGIASRDTSTTQAALDTAPVVESAVRLSGETVDSAYARSVAALPVSGLTLADAGTSAFDSAKPWNALTIASFRYPEWTAPGALEEGFEWARDPRFMVMPGTTFPRRETWLYPDDGCWARAELAADRVAQAGYPRPDKIFVFGQLTVKTDNSPAGQVSWWYHVVPIFRTSTGVWVIDPAIEATRALSVTEWALRMVPSVTDLKVAICSPWTFGPSNSCWSPTHVTEAQAVSADEAFFGDEAFRQDVLHRNPLLVLGNDPPWAPDGGIPDGGL